MTGIYERAAKLYCERRGIKPDISRIKCVIDELERFDVMRSCLKDAEDTKPKKSNACCNGVCDGACER